MATAKLEQQFEVETLASWAEQSTVTDICAFYETLRDGLSEAQTAYADARYRHDHAAAARVVSELTDLTGLLAELQNSSTTGTARTSSTCSRARSGDSEQPRHVEREARPVVYAQETRSVIPI